MGRPASPFPSPQVAGGLPAGPRLASTARSHKLFLALRPGTDDAERIAAQVAVDKARLAIGGKAVEAGRLHVTLGVLCDYAAGGFPAVDVARWCEAVAAVRCAPIDITLDRLARFGHGRRALALRCGDGQGTEGVQRLWRALGAALATSGAQRDGRPFDPHMTVSYGGADVGERPVTPLRWTAREILLVDSHTGAHLHEVLARWPLRA